MTASIRRPILLGGVAAIAILVGFLATIGAPSAQSASLRSCSLTASEQYPREATKPTYNLSLKQRGTTCATAKRVMNAFHRCRSVSGYRCTRKVLRTWTCTGRKVSSSAVQFDGSFTCKRGDRLVRSTYQQNTPG